MIVNETVIEGFGKSYQRALQVLTANGPGWTWDGIWYHQNEKL